MVTFLKRLNISVYPIYALKQESFMHIYLWRHNTAFSSWSMLDEPQIHTSRYTHAEVAVLAGSQEEALDILERNGRWNRKELERIEPEILSLEEPRIITCCVQQ